MDEALKVTCVDYLLHLSSKHIGSTPKSHKKAHGQFMTPPDIASLMVEKLVANQSKETIRILEPAAGTGILLAMLADKILETKVRPKAVAIVAYEIDSALAPILLDVCCFISSKFKELDIKLSYSLNIQDFLLNFPEKKFDIIITNPPFFKIRKSDKRCSQHSSVIHGQPNIYGLFMSKCADVLAQGGRACFLTPRSWTSGRYFSKLRTKLYKTLTLEAIHLFESRAAPFLKDKIQQESMITWYAKEPRSAESVALSFSIGGTDLTSRSVRSAKITEIFPDGGDGCLVLSKLETISLIASFKHTLQDIGLKASTGKVVPFRSTELIDQQQGAPAKPLYWMQHVQRMKVNWPIGLNKEFISDNDHAKKLSLPGSNYVLVRRFSPREDLEHVVAAPLITTPSDNIYIENHLNYIYKTDHALTKEEAFGLAYYLNSKHVSDYFSARLGHTQINASDLNNLPTPSLKTLSRLGSRYLTSPCQIKDGFDSYLAASI